MGAKTAIQGGGGGRTETMPSHLSCPLLCYPILQLLLLDYNCFICCSRAIKLIAAERLTTAIKNLKESNVPLRVDKNRAPQYY